MIKVEALSRTYGKIVAVEGVSFEIGPREIVGLLGHNGAGKTTILKILTGYLEPSGGQVLVNGLSVADNLQEVQTQIGYLPENSPLYPEMSVLGFLDYAANLRGVPEQKKQERIVYALQKTRIVDVAMKQVSTLSRGYKQRLGVAQAILNSPSILILDEPTNGLDPSQILEMRALIKELAETATVIISTHILQEVQAICGRVIVVNKGRLALDSQLEALQASDKISIVVDKKLDENDAVLKDLKLKILESHIKNGLHSYVLKAESQQIYDLSATLVDDLRGSGCRIFAIHPIERDLETIFKEITAGTFKPVSSSEAATPAATQLEEAGAGKSDVIEAQVSESPVVEAKPADPGADLSALHSGGVDGGASE